MKYAIVVLLSISNIHAMDSARQTFSLHAGLVDKIKLTKYKNDGLRNSRELEGVELLVSQIRYLHKLSHLARMYNHVVLLQDPEFNNLFRIKYALHKINKSNEPAFQSSYNALQCIIKNKDFEQQLITNYNDIWENYCQCNSSILDALHNDIRNKINSVPHPEARKYILDNVAQLLSTPDHC